MLLTLSISTIMAALVLECVKLSLPLPVGLGTKAQRNNYGTTSSPTRLLRQSMYLISAIGLTVTGIALLVLTMRALVG